MLFKSLSRSNNSHPNGFNELELPMYIPMQTRTYVKDDIQMQIEL